MNNRKDITPIIAALVLFLFANAAAIPTLNIIANWPITALVNRLNTKSPVVCIKPGINSSLNRAANEIIIPATDINIIGLMIAFENF